MTFQIPAQGFIQSTHFAALHAVHIFTYAEETVSLCVSQGEPAEQDDADDSRQSVHLLLADAHEARFREQGHAVHHQTQPVGYRELHPAVQLLLLRRRNHGTLRQRRDVASTRRAHGTHRTRHGGVTAGSTASSTNATAADSTPAALRTPHLTHLFKMGKGKKIKSFLYQDDEF